MSVERKSLRRGGATIAYRIRRSARRKKTLQLTIDDDGAIVASPMNAPDADIRRFVLKNADWILESIAQRKALIESSRLISGNALPYLGREVRLAIRDEAALGARLEFDDGTFNIVVPYGLTPDERDDAIRREVVAWYLRQAERVIGEMVDRWWRFFAGANGRRPPALIRDQRRRWGSCSSDGTLRFNWRLVMLGEDIIEYVVVHELSHLEQMNHSPKFWEVVAKRLPDYKERRRTLKEAGGNLPSL